MRVLILASGMDTGGQGHRIRDAFATHEPDWQVDSLALMASPFGYPDQYAAIGGIKRRLLAPELYRLADVVHLRNSLYAMIGRGDKPVVLHHHGSAFRLNHARLDREAAKVGAVQVASTLDLTLLERDITWCPVPYDLDALPQLVPHDGIVVSHFPTNPRIKSSALVKAAAEALPVGFLTNLDSKARQARQWRWDDVLAEKARSDIYVDQLILGYGNNAVEAWGMGLPVVAGVRDPAVREVMLDRFGSLPFAEATEATLADVLRRMVESAAMRAEYAARGREHAERWHSGAETVSVLRDAYARAAARQLRAVA